MVPTRFSHLPEARARFGDRVDRLGAFLGRVDPLADDVVAAIEGTPGGWQLFDEEHRSQAMNTAPGNPSDWRATVWELHPVTAFVILSP